MQRKFTWVEPGEDGVTPVFQTISEDELLKSYYPYWQKQMLKVGKADLITPENCIEDFMVIHWASEVPQELDEKREAIVGKKEGL